HPRLNGSPAKAARKPLRVTCIPQRHEEHLAGVGEVLVEKLVFHGFPFPLAASGEWQVAGFGFLGARAAEAWFVGIIVVRAGEHAVTVEAPEATFAVAAEEAEEEAAVEVHGWTSNLGLRARAKRVLK